LAHSAGPGAALPDSLALSTVIEISEAISGEIDLAKLTGRLMKVALEQTGATRGVLLLPQRTDLWIEVEGRAAGQGVAVSSRELRVARSNVPHAVLQEAIRTQGTVLLDDVPARARFHDDDYLSKGLCRSALCLALVKQVALVGVLYLENDTRSHIFTPARQAVLKVLASQAAMSLDAARLYRELQVTEAYLKEAQRLTHTGNVACNIDSGQIFVMSEEACRIYEIDLSMSPTVNDIFARVHPDDLHIVETHCRGVGVTEGQTDEFQHRIVMPDGRVKTLRVVSRAVRASTGELQFNGTVMDVSDYERSQAALQASLEDSRRMDERLRASLREKEALLKEVHHRVKNNLQLISSLLSLQAAQTTNADVAELFLESRNRVRSMALVHENLYRAGDFSKIAMSEHIETLCAHLVRAYGMRSQRVDLVTAVDNVELELEVAMSVGLIVNELVSNALKHAFPDGRSGRVTVELKGLTGTRHELMVRDDGIGLDPALVSAEGDTLGLQLVYDLAKKLDGAVRIDREGGTRFSVTFEADGLPSASR